MDVWMIEVPLETGGNLLGDVQEVDGCVKSGFDLPCTIGVSICGLLCLSS